MKKSRFTEEQIVGILKESEAGWRPRSCTASMALANRRFTVGALKKVAGPLARREAVRVFREAVKCSERHACGQLEVLRAMVRYRSRGGRFAEASERLRTRLRELAEQWRRWGYRRLHILLEREGWEVNSKRVYRIYVEEKLGVRRRKRRRRICA